MDDRTQTSTYYTYDAAGNPMARYTAITDSVDVGSGYQMTRLQLDEHSLYGSSRLGIDRYSTALYEIDLAHGDTTIYTTNTDTIFEVGYRQYELTNHLGNVLATVSDKKLAIDCSADSNIAYVAEVLSTTDYYPYGMLKPGRQTNPAEYHFGYQGSEKDDEVKGTGNTYDFGARFYDSRLGRWMKMDAYRHAYSSVSPYAFVLNTPIRAVDPDGNVVIYVNGEVGQFMGKLGLGHPERGSVLYWGANFVLDMNWAFQDFSTPRFVDGDVASSVSQRYGYGKKQGKADFADIIKGLQRDENGKIVETIKVVSHSKGSSFANGYIEGLREMIEENKDLFADPDNVIESHLMLAPHQSWGIHVKESSTITIAITNEADWLSDDDASGDVLNFRAGDMSSFNPNGWILRTHKLSSYHEEALDMANKISNQVSMKPIYRQTLKNMKNPIRMRQDKTKTKPPKGNDRPRFD